MKTRPSPTMLLAMTFIFTTISVLLPYIPSTEQVMLSTYVIAPLTTTAIFYYFMIRKDPKTGVPSIYRKSKQDIAKFKSGAPLIAKTKITIQGALASAALTIPFLPGIYTYPALLLKYSPLEQTTFNAKILSIYKPRKIPRTKIIIQEIPTGRTLKFFWSSSGAASLEEKANITLTVKESWFGTYIINISKTQQHLTE